MTRCLILALTLIIAALLIRRANRTFDHYILEQTNAQL